MPDPIFRRVQNSWNRVALSNRSHVHPMPAAAKMRQCSTRFDRQFDPPAVYQFQTITILVIAKHEFGLIFVPHGGLVGYDRKVKT
jgi:hypothetical protein